MSYFEKNTINFLQNLKENNDKVWFKENENDYRRFVLEPLQDLVVDLSDTILNIDDEIETNPAIGKTISRIYRDIRFSKDKSPFRSNMWITFKRPIKDWQDYPGFFFEIAPDHYCYGMGFYNAAIKTMDIFRKKIQLFPEGFRKVISFLNNDKSGFTVGGDSYKRILNDTIPDDLKSWYQKKSFYVIKNIEINERLFSDDLLKSLSTDFKMLKPLYRYMLSIKKEG